MILSYQQVSICREEQSLFEGLDFTVGEGEFIYLMGRVGSGKSSLLKTIYGEVPISAGEAHVFDFDLVALRSSQLPLLRRKLGIVFQDFRLLHDRTVNANLEFVLRATGWKEKAPIANRIREVLKQVGMENKGYRMPNTLSGGEQQRVVIARALLNRPQLILADEPTGNLDPETAHEVVSLLYEVAKQENTAVIMSTHNTSFLEEFPGRVLRVENRGLSEEQSSPVMEEEVATAMEEESSPIEEEEEVTVMEEQPSPIEEEEVATAMEEQPSPVEEEEVATAMEEESSPVEEEEGVTGIEKQPSPTSEEKPAPTL